ncbi:MAG: thioredoxin [Spirochaetes bacterium]|nr:thioredoxin [Spirochaetota bacterium]
MPLAFLASALAGAEEKAFGDKEYKAGVPARGDSAFIYAKDEALTGKVVVANDEWFSAAILDSTYPVCVFFWAPWNGPSRMAMPEIEGPARDYKSRMKFVQVNADEASVACAEYAIASLPAILFFKNGKVTGRVDGSVPRSALKSMISKQLK